MKNVSSQGASLSHRYLQTLLAVGLALMVANCKKDKEAPAVIEEVPAAASAETDTSATLAEEPNLQQVGKDKPGSAKNTFHPTGKLNGKPGGKNAGSASGAPSASADQAGFSDNGHYVVQVAVFKSKRQAANLVEKLANSGYPAYVAEVENPVPALAGTYHRVRIGKFLHRSAAKSFGENTLKPMGYEFWVDNKKNDAVGGEGSGVSAPEPAAAPAPVSRKSKKKHAEEPAAPSEPVAPSGETWGNPKTNEPVTPSGETWGTPKTEEPATPSPKTESAPATEMPATKTPAPPPTPSTPASAPAKAPGDTGKVNLDEW